MTRPRFFFGANLFFFGGADDQRRGRRTINVIVTKYAQRLTIADRGDQTLGRHIHTNQPGRVRKRITQGGIKELFGGIKGNSPRGHHPAHDLGNTETL